MAYTAGTISLVNVSSTTVNLAVTAASGGTGPYTQQWYRSTVSGFSPGAGNILAGQTALTLADTGLTFGTNYFYKVVFEDTGNSNAQITSAQLEVQTSVQSLSMNQFAQTPYIGTVDQNFNYNVRSVQVDFTASGPVYSGQAVKVSSTAGGVPKVVPCAADSDLVYGWIIFNFKDVSYAPGAFCEISFPGTVQWLLSTTAIARGQQVTLDLTSIGGVGAFVPSSGANLVGTAYDVASAPGQLIRINIEQTTTLA